MLISKKYNFIFIHIYKNAGISITDALLPFAASRWQQRKARLLRRFHMSTESAVQPFRVHIAASEVIGTMGREKFDSFFSFAIVRNPWDWQVSLYNFILKDSSNHHHKLVRSLGNFDTYIRWRCAEGVAFQKDFIYSADGELLVDFVGRYESLEADFATVCSRLGISTFLPKFNVSNTKPYQQFYTEETKQLVRRAFDEDITLFNYDF